MTTFDPKTPRKCRPPKGSVPSQGTYFRVVFNNPPTQEDFVIWIDEPENRHHLEQKTKANDCGAFAISMLLKEGLERSTGLFLRAMRKKAKKRNAAFLGWAQVALDPTCGVIKQTGQNPHHYDLWPYINRSLKCKVTIVRKIPA